MQLHKGGCGRFHGWERGLANGLSNSRRAHLWPGLQSRAGHVHRLTTIVVGLASTKVTAADRVAPVNGSGWHAWLAIRNMFIVHIRIVLRGALPLSDIAADSYATALFGDAAAEFGTF